MKQQELIERLRFAAIYESANRAHKKMCLAAIAEIQRLDRHLGIIARGQGFAKSDWAGDQEYGNHEADWLKNYARANRYEDE